MHVGSISCFSFCLSSSWSNPPTSSFYRSLRKHGLSLDTGPGRQTAITTGGREEKVPFFFSIHSLTPASLGLKDNLEAPRAGTTAKCKTGRKPQPCCFWAMRLDADQPPLAPEAASVIYCCHLEAARDMTMVVSSAASLPSHTFTLSHSLLGAQNYFIYTVQISMHKHTCGHHRISLITPTKQLSSFISICIQHVG